MMPVVNFDQTDSGGGNSAAKKIVPDGWYPAKIAVITEKQSKAGNPMWSVCFECWEEGAEAPFSVWDNLVFFGKALNRVKCLYKALELPHEGEINCHPSDVAERKLGVLLKVGEWGGNKRMETDGFDPFCELKMVNHLATQYRAEKAAEKQQAEGEHITGAAPRATTTTQFEGTKSPDEVLGGMTINSDDIPF